MLSPEETAELKRHQRQTKDKSVYTKVTCILMLSKGFSAEIVSGLVGYQYFLCLPLFQILFRRWSVRIYRCLLQRLPGTAFQC
jgi:hypothetical protein